jgi:triacylglycerol lipase
VVQVQWSGTAPLSQYPIVLVHGMGGWSSIAGYEYFYDIPERLRAVGFEVYVASLTPLAKPSQRAQELKQQIQTWTSGKVNIIAHSQGTIDARYMISKLGMAAQVASYTSIAGPHLGSRVADVALGLVPGPVQQAIDFLLRQLGFDWGAVQAMSEDEMVNHFNPSVVDDPSVYYQSYVGIADPFGVQTGTAISAYLVAPWGVLAAVDGAPSDGLVTVPSGKWGNFRGTMAADHITEVGQLFGLTHFDFRKFFEDVALDLAARGF